MLQIHHCMTRVVECIMCCVVLCCLLFSLKELCYALIGFRHVVRLAQVVVKYELLYFFKPQVVQLLLQFVVAVGPVAPHGFQLFQKARLLAPKRRHLFQHKPEELRHGFHDLIRDVK